MTKLLSIMCLLLMAVGCTHKKLSGDNTQKDSMVVVYGFAELPIDSGIEMPYKELKAYKDSFAPIYDNNTGNIVFMRSKCRHKYGDWYVDDSGDTLFLVDEIFHQYVSAAEWHKYYESYK